MEQPLAMGNDAQGGSAAGHHTFEKLEFKVIKELREPHRHCPKTAQANMYTRQGGTVPQSWSCT